MKRLTELSLTAQNKAWIKIRAWKFKWSIERIRENLRKKHGEDVAPESIRAFISGKEQLPVTVSKLASRSRIGRQTESQRNIQRQLEADSGDAERQGEFDPKSPTEGKQKTLRRITLRWGRPKFRKNLLSAYGGRCAITGCDCEDALEAAHILPYDGNWTDHVQNGLLLRGDVHTLFDLGRIGIDASTMKVLVANSLKKTFYGSLEGKTLRLPSRKKNYPNEEVLRKHAKRWGLKGRP